jgi:hypothetical protein
VFVNVDGRGDLRSRSVEVDEASVILREGEGANVNPVRLVAEYLTEDGKSVPGLVVF